MTIACLGWGSLVWDPRELPIAGEWSADGPSLPLEFARESRDGRMTLVIVEHDAPVPTFWVALAVDSLDEAVDALMAREGVPSRGSIGRWPSRARAHRRSEAIGRWAAAKGLDGVVWTDLQPGFGTRRGAIPSLDAVIRHLETLQADARGMAARYIVNAPAQIVTPYRAALQRLFK